MTKRKLAAVSRKTPENTRNSQSQNTLDPAQVSEEIEGRVTKNLSKKFSRMKSRILGALSKLDEFLLNPQVRSCSVAVPGTFRNNDSENRQPTGDRSLGDPCPEALFFTYHSGNLSDSELEETHHNRYVKFFFNSCGTLIWVRIIPVKVDRSLTGIIRTYVIILVRGGL